MQILTCIDAGLCCGSCWIQFRLFRKTKHAHKVEFLTATIGMVFYFVFFLVGVPLESFGKPQLPAIVGPLYVMLCVIIAIVHEMCRFVLPGGYGEFRMDGNGDRATEIDSARRSGAVFHFITIILAIGAFFYFMTGMNKSKVSPEEDNRFPNVLYPIIAPGFVVAALHLGLELASYRVRRCCGDNCCLRWLHVATRGQFGITTVFWVAVHGTYVMLMVQWLCPSVFNVTYTMMCVHTQKEGFVLLTCAAASTFNWAACIIVSMSLFWLTFEQFKMLA